MTETINWYHYYGNPTERDPGTEVISLPYTDENYALFERYQKAYREWRNAETDMRLAQVAALKEQLDGEAK